LREDSVILGIVDWDRCAPNASKLAHSPRLH
jgi:hypothetical protein